MLNLQFVDALQLDATDHRRDNNDDRYKIELDWIQTSIFLLVNRIITI